MKKNFKVEIEGGDCILATAEIENQTLHGLELKIIGRPALQQLLQQLAPQLKGPLNQIAVPQLKTPEGLLVRQLVLKLRGEWGEEPPDPELCHCRKISQVQVERAIILGAHTVEKVRQRSSANTGCGTCLPEVEALLEKYLKSSSLGG